MLDKLDYDKLVLMAFESLKRDIKDCEDYTVRDYNSILDEENKRKVAQQKAELEKQVKEVSPKAQPTVTTVPKTKKEDK